MKYVNELINRYPVLLVCKESIENAIKLMIDMYENNGILYIAGNGGSAADADHIVGELMKGFIKKRKMTNDFKDKLCHVDNVIGEELYDVLQRGLAAINLNTHNALHTAYANDVDYTYIYAQMLFGYIRNNDIFFGISTSGNSKNILKAVTVAKAKGAKTIALTGKTGGKMKDYFDITIKVPETETYKIQELHLPIYHAICLQLEDYFYEQ
ncbi:hypothetical protein HMPREF9628_01529 [Peptoanaerobacter stomatis]|uniref:SIS domain-containing protein n=1 Tax=Peptoanaerobacter stomatis TaxID=796937 RepID=G9XCF2_9FIRM|nr:SIS domain-containing protein [Peptoanaerobacter stomatis]EHL19345.1 hypothetical protein HMPREF9628_01529 [Peptoanaerobacter stomatis]